MFQELFSDGFHRRRISLAWSGMDNLEGNFKIELFSPGSGNFNSNNEGVKTRD
jgi:hypothetical protein